MSVDFRGVDQLQRVLRSAPADVRKSMRETGKREVAEPLARVIRSRESGADNYGLYLSSSVRARQANVPTVVMGGKRSAGVSGGATLADLVYGTEFGADRDSYATYSTSRGRVTRRTKRQFRARRREGYEFYPTFKREAPQALKRWEGWLKDTVRKWKGVRY